MQVTDIPGSPSGPVSEGLTARETERLSELFEAQQTNADSLRQSPFKDRIARLQALETAVMDAEEDIHSALSEDFSKPFEEVLLTEINTVIIEIRHARRNLHRWLKPRRVKTPRVLAGTTSEVRFEAKGESLIISPWNYPFALTLGPLVGAVAAGCPVIVKPSELTPHSASVIQSIVESVFPPEEICVVQGGARTAEALLELPFRHVYFTGSPQVGSRVMAAAARHLASVTLELGGKSPAIIDETADLKTAALKISFGKFANTGQTCIAPDYLLVEDSIYDRFTEKLKEAIQSQYGIDADARRQTQDLTRIISRRHTERLIDMLEEATAAGAEIILGGSHDLDAHYVEPTLITGVPEDTALMQEEIFGPILPVIRYRTRKEIFRAIHRHREPLSMYIFSDDSEAIEAYLNGIPAGGVCINETLLHFINPELPFGGLGTSGIGRGHGYAGFLAFSNEKAVLRQHLGNQLFGRFYPPFGKNTRIWVRSLIKLS